MTHDAKAKAIADKIAAKVDAALDPLQRQMDIMKWPHEFRSIMWNAVAHHALLNADEADKARRQEHSSPTTPGAA